MKYTSRQMINHNITVITYSNEYDEAKAIHFNPVKNTYEVIKYTNGDPMSWLPCGGLDEAIEIYNNLDID